MRRTRFDDWPCPVARATDLIGDWWTPLVLRNALFGVTRFEQFQSQLGIPRAVLTTRLQRLCDEGLMEKRDYQDRPVRSEYHLTDKGRAFGDVLLALWRWGDDWLFAPDGAPVVLKDRESGAVVRPTIVDEATGDRLDVGRLRMGRAPRAEATT